MQQRHYRQRGAARAQAVQRSQAPWMLAMLTAGGIVLLGWSLAHAQTGNVQSGPAPTGPVPTAPGQTAPAPVPEVVKPPAGSTGASGVPDTGVISPPSTAGTTPVIPPPTVGTMPVIPPPGTAGSGSSVVPK